MAYSKSAIRVTFSIWICLSRCSAESINMQDQSIDDSIVSDIMKYVQPYFKSFQIGNESFFPRANDQNIVIEAIDAKVKQLKPYFEDSNFTVNKEKDDHLELEGTDETTIVEFVPKPQKDVVRNSHDQFLVINNGSEPDSFQTSIRKYKKMRNKIKFALEKEPVSKKTKKMVIQTVDDMIARLVESQCPWKDDPVKSFRRSFFDNYTFHNNGSCYFYNKIWSKDECDEIKERIAVNLEKKFTSTIKDLSGNPFYDMFSKTVTTVLRDSQTIADKYKVRCSVIDLGKNKIKYGYSRRSDCDDFRLCSGEFRRYLLDFYNSLNDTAVSVFKNYAAMYLRDVNADESDEKLEVITTINNASDTVADEIIKLFIRQTSKITFVEKGNRDANIAVIKEYVRKTINHFNKRIEKHIEGYLTNLRERIIQGVKKDITVNLGVDLGNLESHFIAKICSLFVTCNGEVARSFRKRFQSLRDKEKSNRVFVKVQLTLDDVLKNTLVNKHKAMLRSLKSKKPFLRNQYKFAIKSVVKDQVTRTTTEADLVTKIDGSNVAYTVGEENSKINDH